ncbi:hypothetical protein B0H11DRAFT_2235352 [Mycena galericulata]|nr:hypothetical protein B0H11DRAFT_2246289 [Mycena galericulata]KAJ7475397.1 hypothetical protein B0H11DRAFT_2235352 [Mycena galericulata]
MHSPAQCPPWPPTLPSMDALLDYLNKSEPPALFLTSYGVHFSSPKHNWSFDVSAYRNADASAPFVAMIFGRVEAPPTFEDRQCVFHIDGGSAIPERAASAFRTQISVLTAPMCDKNEKEADSSSTGAEPIRFKSEPIDAWTDVDQRTRTGGSRITLHVWADGTSTVHTPKPDSTELNVHSPRRVASFPFAAGDWVVASVTLHRRDHDVKVYQVLARHIRVLPQDAFDLCAYNAVDGGGFNAEDASSTRQPHSLPLETASQSSRRPVTRSQTMHALKRVVPDHPNDITQAVPQKKRRVSTVARMRPTRRPPRYYFAPVSYER